MSARRLIFGLSLAIVLAHVLLATFAFPQADTFHVAKFMQSHTPWEFAYSSYFNWSGRWLPYALIAVATEPSLFPDYLPLILMLNFVLFAVVLGFVLSRLFTGAPRLLPVLDIAAILLLLPLSIKKEAFYWLDTSLIYVTPLWLLGLAWLLHPGRGKWIVPVLMFMAASFCEQLSLLLLLLLLATGQHNRRVFWPVCIACAVMLLSPGNWLRMGWFADYIPGERQLLHMALDTVTYSLAYLAPYMGALLAYGILRSALFKAEIVPAFKSWGGWLLLVIIGEALVSIFPAIYSYKGTYNIGGRIFLGVAIIAAPICLLAAHNVYARFCNTLSKTSLIMLGAIVAIMCAKGVNDLIVAWQVAPSQKAFAMQQLNEIANAAKRGEQRITLKASPFPDNMLVYKTMSGDIANEDYWVNEAIADYYGLKAITIEK